jgi:hypothetical protein
MTGLGRSETIGFPSVCPLSGGKPFINCVVLEEGASPTKDLIWIGILVIYTVTDFLKTSPILVRPFAGAQG